MLGSVTLRSVSSYNANIAGRSEAEVTKEMQDHGGELVARSLDGTQTYGYAGSYPAIYALLAGQGLQPHEAVVAHVDEVGVDEMF